MLTFQNEDLRARLAEHLNADAADINFLPFSDVVESIHEDVAVIRNSPFISDEVPAFGFVYDVRSGRLQQVE